MPAFFCATVGEFLTTIESSGLDKLTAKLAAQGFSLTPDQRIAWTEEWSILKDIFQTISSSDPSSLSWSLLLEYPIPGRRKRIDAVVLTTKGIVVVEFKSGTEVTSAARWQVREYCWNLRDFHRESRNVRLAPILCVVQSAYPENKHPLTFSDRQEVILDLQVCNRENLAESILRACASFHTGPDCRFDSEKWDQSPFQPTPSVIEFAQQVFGGHEVREIHHAASENTDATLERIRIAIGEAQKTKKRIVCFVTGVPGAGKTLVGLNAAFSPEIGKAAKGPICFASGNKPLLDVLTTAIIRDKSTNSRRRREISNDLTAPIQNVHEFVRKSLVRTDIQPPAFQVIIFDEAQRVWNSEKLRKGLQNLQRYGQLTQAEVDRILSYGESEPDLVLSLMERCSDWCVVVALVGGGQEIHDGEAGLAAWGCALTRKRIPWTVWASEDALAGGVSNSGQKLFSNQLYLPTNVVRFKDLHLSVSKRSLRAEHFPEWVNHVVNGNVESAHKTAAVLEEFPVLLARDLSVVRELIRAHADKNQRCGLLASSGALRLRAEGIEVSPEFRKGIKFAEWFLRPAGDIRSSSQLEVAATEFECQGLELDWCGVCWGGDFVKIPNATEWQFRRLQSPGGISPKWATEKNPETCEFIRNKYRVLLTRSRIGVIIYIPHGSTIDPTQSKEIFDSTADFLIRCGAAEFKV